MWFGVIAASGVVLAAVYMLWMFQRVVWGEVTHEANRNLKDLSIREWAVVVPLVVIMFWIGLYPKPFLEKTEASVKHLITQVQSRQAGNAASAIARLNRPTGVRPAAGQTD